MTQQLTTNTTLVIGGTGKTGRRVVEQLQQQQLPVRVGSRHNDPAFDWQNSATWQAALHGVKSVYLTFYPDLAVPGAPQAIEQFCDVALQEGVEHIVLLSGRGELEAQRCEQIVQGKGMDWTIIRASWFCQNFSEGAFCESILEGALALPVSDTPEPFIDIDDIADVAVAALTHPIQHKGQLYEVTGPSLLNFSEVANILSEELGRHIAFVPLTTSQFEEALREQKQPEGMIQLLTYLFTEVLDGRNAYIADGVQRALGRPARGFRDYVIQQVKSGVWNV